MLKKFIYEHKEEIELFNRGEAYKSYEFFGVHKYGGGYIFAVWAPNAEKVSLVGDFNNWDADLCPMENFDGVWCFLSNDIKEGDIYKYAVTNCGKTVLKTDPYSFYSELRPGNASVVKNLSKLKKNTEYYNKKTENNIFKSPVNIYEVHLGSFMRKPDNDYLTYREIAPKLLNYVLEMGYNFVELMPITEYPLDASWGYQTTGYFSLTSRYGEPEDFKFFVELFHNAGIGVIMDWVPGHFCKDIHGLYMFDGTNLYESDDEIISENPGWGTRNFDFSKPQVQSFLISGAFFWMDYYGIDGIRVDAVANIIFNNFCKPSVDELKNKEGGFENLKGIEFLKKLNKTIHEHFPGNIMCAEDSSDYRFVTSKNPDNSLGFDFKWNMGWMNDALRYIKIDSVYKKYSHNNLTFLMHYAFDENFILPVSHDEVVHGKCSLLEKMPGYRKDKFAQVKSFFVYMYGMPGKKLSFMGNEFAHSLEWRFYEQLEWNLLQFSEYAGVKQAISDINHIYLQNKSMWENDGSWEGFCWCNANDSDKSIVSFARISDDKKNVLVFVVNFTPVKYENMFIGVPYYSEYEEIFSTDSFLYGGDNVVNRGIISPYSVSEGEQRFSIKIDIPPYGGIVFRKIS